MCLCMQANAILCSYVNKLTIPVQNSIDAQFTLTLDIIVQTSWAQSLHVPEGV